MSKHCQVENCGGNLLPEDWQCPYGHAYYEPCSHGRVRERGQQCEACATEEMAKKVEALSEELRPHRERELERVKKRGAYWLSAAGRAEIRETWNDPDDGNAVLPLLDALEAAEKERDEARETNRTLHRRVQAAESDEVTRAEVERLRAGFARDMKRTREGYARRLRVLRVWYKEAVKAVKQIVAAGVPDHVDGRPGQREGQLNVMVARLIAQRDDARETRARLESAQQEVERLTRRCEELEISETSMSVDFENMNKRLERAEKGNDR